MYMNAHRDSQVLAYLLLASTALFTCQATGQEYRLKNGGFEQWDENSIPMGWRFVPSPDHSKYKLSHQTTDVVEGNSAVLVDSMEVTVADNNTFGNLDQTIDATPFRGKRVQFSAKVRVTRSEGNGRAQLWFRVDRQSKDGKATYGAFDNMKDRPITEDQWKTYTIVGQVDDDAQKIVIGMLVLGNAVAWIDSAELKIVGDDVPETGKTSANSSTPSMQREPDPRQPFFNHWLWLPLVAILLFSISYCPIVTCPIDPVTKFNSEYPDRPIVWTNYVFRFAFRFSFVYWIAYSFPKLLVAFVPYLGAMFNVQYQKFVDFAVRWIGKNVMQIEGHLVAPNGSGDTTYSYILAFITFCFAIAFAIVWSAIDWRKTDYCWLRDLLRSYLRYVLAITMLSYGLAKATFITSQFPDPSVDQLTKTYGESSPMNILWTFMGASRAYTFFCGVG